MFINSDPALIRFFLRFLDAAGTPRTRLRFRVYIHENADVAAAQQFWLDVTGATASRTPGARDPPIPPSRYGRYRVRTAAAAAMFA
jgi:hypothetical protein